MIDQRDRDVINTLFCHMMSRTHSSKLAQFGYQSVTQ